MEGLKNTEDVIFDELLVDRKFAVIHHLRLKLQRTLWAEIFFLYGPNAIRL
jgi:hypothetical protein